VNVLPEAAWTQAPPMKLDSVSAICVTRPGILSQDYEKSDPPFSESGHPQITPIAQTSSQQHDDRRHLPNPRNLRNLRIESPRSRMKDA
jgi:hypothetical protein